MIRSMLVTLTSGLLLSAALADEGGSAPAADVQTILGNTSCWRSFCVWRTPVVKTEAGLAETAAQDFICRSAPLPEGWQHPGFVDSQWSRCRLGEDKYGFKNNGAGDPSLMLRCVRGKFLVDDPGRARGVKVSVAYRGGVVVFVNGREVARAHLPKDAKLPAEALADDYPREAFLKPDGGCIRSAFGDPKTFADQVEKRVRRLEDVAIDPDLLRKGVNVLAVEAHRAAYQGPGIEKENMGHETVWSTCGIVSVELVAAGGLTSNTARPGGVQVWNSSAMARSTPDDHADPLEKLGPVSITAARNGAFIAKVVVGSGQPLRGVKAAVSDLVHEAGKGTLPASAVKVLYTVRDDRHALRHQASSGFWDTLLEEPPAEVEPVEVGREGRIVGAIQPIVLKLRVPADAAPGRYEGKLTVTTGAGPAAETPVRLNVVDWKLPDPREFTVHMGLIQSPESVALWYKAPLWGEEHWRLLEKSFALMAEVGNKVVCIPMICRTNFGNEQSMIRWVKEGDKYRYDWSVFDRYLDLAQKHLKPDVVWLYVWDKYTGESRWAGRGDTEGKGALVTLYDPTTGKSEEMEWPRLGTPEGKAFWTPVYKEVRERLERRGLLAVTMMGTNGDAYWPTKAIAEMFKEVMPGTPWINSSHADSRGGSMNGIPIGYNTEVYNGFFPPPGQSRPAWHSRNDKHKDGYFYGWMYKTDKFPRSSGAITGGNPLYPVSHLALHRVYCEACLMGNDSGLGRIGADFWPVMEPPKQRTTGKRSETINGRFVESCWNQLNMNTATEAVLAPGPNGAVSTERFEQIREGMQECEARIFIERALLDPASRAKLGDKAAKECRAVLDERAWQIRSACIGRSMGWNWYEAAGSAGLTENLFVCAADVAAKLGER